MGSRRRVVTVAGATVVAPTAPTLTAPADELNVYVGQGITCSATVTAGQVPDRIDWVLNPGGSEIVVATDSSSPYSATWTVAEAAASYTLVARFVYGSGSVDSTAIDVHVWASVASRAAGAWVPAGMTESGGKVTAWASSGTGGTDYNLASVSGPTDPTYSATGDRAGTGPACTLVRASATKLATAAFTLAQPNTMVWVCKITSGKAANMRMQDGRTGNTHGIYMSGAGLSPVVNDGAGTTIAIASNFTQDVWGIVAGVYNGSGASASSGWLGSTETAGTLAGTSCSGIVLGDFGTVGGAAFDGVVERGYCFGFALSDAEFALLRTELGF